MAAIVVVVMGVIEGNGYGVIGLAAGGVVVTTMQ